MKKLSILLAAVLAIGILFTGCGKKEKVLVMATEPTFRPYEYMAGNEVVGVDVEIAQALADALGMTLEIDTMDFDAVIPAVQSGKADFGAAGISIRPDRLEQVDFSIEYAKSIQVILTTADSGIETEEDLNGKTIGVQMATTADLEYGDKDAYPEITVDSFTTYSDAAMELANGRIDAIVLDNIPAMSLQAAYKDQFIISEEELFTDTYAIAVQKGNTEMLEAINKVLQEMIDQGKIEELTEKHLAD